MQEIIETRHIKEEMWIALKNNTILPEQYVQILEHTCECTGCADRLATIMKSEQEEQVKPVSVQPPSYLSEQILERVKQVDVQTAVAVKQTSRSVQLLMYSLRVGAAVLASIFILAITSNFQNTDFSQLEQIQSDKQTESEEELYPDNSTGKDAHQDKSILDKVNQATNGLTEKMNEFTNKILNGGKKE